MIAGIVSLILALAFGERKEIGRNSQALHSEQSHWMKDFGINVVGGGWLNSGTMWGDLDQGGTMQWMCLVMCVQNGLRELQFSSL